MEIGIGIKEARTLYDPAYQGAEMKNWVDFVQERFQKMEYVKRQENVKIRRCRQLYMRGLRAYQSEDPYNTAYRSARFFSTVQSWVDEYAENMPETVLKSSDWRDSSAKEKTTAIEISLKVNEEENAAEAEKIAALEDAAKSGTGVLHEVYNAKMENMFSIYVDPMFFYIDDCCRVWYGGNESGENDARDCDWLRFLPYSTFLDLYEGVEGVDVSQVKPGFINNAGEFSVITSWDQYNYDTNKDKYMVKIHDYHNRELKYDPENEKSKGVHIVIANHEMILIEEMQTKKLPYTLYHHIKRNDSPWGIGAIEISAPEVFALDTMTELAFRDAKLSMQKVVVGDAGSGFHTGLKVAPGQMWSFPVKGNRRIQDVVAQLEFGGISSDFFALYDRLLDNYSITTQIDQRALLANPNQLATQTVAKKESFQKRVRTIIKRNLWSGEKFRTEIRVELFQEYYVKTNPVFDVDGYFVLYNDSDHPKFIKDSLGTGSFRATASNTNVKCRVAVVESSKRAALDEEERGRYLQFLQVVVSIQNSDPQGKAAETIDFAGLVEVTAEKIGIDKRRVIKNHADKYSDKFKIDLRRIGLGLSVAVPQEETQDELFTRLDAYRGYLEDYRNQMSPRMLDSLTNLIIQVYELLDRMGQVNTEPVAPSPELAMIAQNADMNAAAGAQAGNVPAGQGGKVAAPSPSLKNPKQGQALMN